MESLYRFNLTVREEEGEVLYLGGREKCNALNIEHLDMDAHYRNNGRRLYTRRS